MSRCRVMWLNGVGSFRNILHPVLGTELASPLLVSFIFSPQKSGKSILKPWSGERDKYREICLFYFLAPLWAGCVKVSKKRVVLFSFLFPPRCLHYQMVGGEGLTARTRNCLCADLQASGEHPLFHTPSGVETNLKIGQVWRDRLKKCHGKAWRDE